MKARVKFAPIKNETVVVLDESGKVLGTIKRYRVWKRCIVNVPGILTAAANRGEVTFDNIKQAKEAIIAKAAKQEAKSDR